MKRTRLLKAVMSVGLVLFVGLVADSFSAAGADALPVKGLIRVRKDGKGDFKRIMSAVIMSEPGEIIEIADSETYRESLHLASFPRRTIRAGKGARPTLNGAIYMGNYCVIDGLKITYPITAPHGENTIFSSGKMGWVVKNCDIYDIPSNANAFYMVNGTRNTKILSNRIHGGKGGAIDLSVQYNKGNNLIANNVFYDGAAIDIRSNSPNNRLVSNTFYRSYIKCASSSTVMENNILVSTAVQTSGPFRYNCLWQSKGKIPPGQENIEVNPLFVDPANADFHLKSKTGRWDPKTKKWVKDAVHSPCIDAGDPKADCKNEPDRKRINMGAYGNTAYASAGPQAKWPLPAPKAKEFPAPKITPGPRKDYAALMKKYGWIQAKIDALGPKGGVVEIPEGTHTIAVPIVIDRSNVTLRGAGPDKTTIKSLKDITIIRVGGMSSKLVSNVTIRDLHIHGKRSEGGAVGRGVHFYHVSKSLVENVRIQNCGGGGVFLHWCESCTVKKSKINHIRATCVLTFHSKRSLVTENVLSFGMYGLDFQSEQEGTATRNVCHSNGNGGIKLYSGARNCIITDNLCYSNNDDGIIVLGAAGSRIERNIYRNNRRFGIYACGPYRNNGVVIRNNWIYSNQKGGITFHPMVYKYPHKITVESNIIDSNQGNGIWLSDWKKYKNYYIVTARNNIITNNKGYGLILAGATAALTSSYNDVWNNTLGSYKGISAGAGDISSDPLFADPAKGDFHLKSKAGRWDPKSKKWVKDAANSPCIDAGDPKVDFSKEPPPNGGRINMGAYGNTAEASRSESGAAADE